MEVLHDGVAARHGPDADGEDDGEDRREPLGHGGDGQRDAEEQDRDRVARVVDTVEQGDRSHDDDRDADDEQAEHLRDGRDLPLEGRGLLLRPIEQVGDLAHLRFHAGAR